MDVQNTISKRSAPRTPHVPSVCGNTRVVLVSLPELILIFSFLKYITVK